jgi:phospholipase/carboxylesterase
MLSRRALLQATLSGFAALGCKRSDPQPQVQSSSSLRRSTHEDVAFIELFPNGADESSPLLVFIHGRGDAPEHWIDEWKAFPAKAQIALPRAFHSYGDGFSWFDFREGMSDAELGANVAAAESKLWRAVAKLAGSRKPVVTGFSQGGILSFAIAARHADNVAYAFPVAGASPGPLLPTNQARSAKLVAFHGTADHVVAYKWGAATVDAFKAQGNEATLRSYAGVGHTMTREMRADLHAAIQRALPVAP